MTTKTSTIDGAFVETTIDRLEKITQALKTHRNNLQDGCFVVGDIFVDGCELEAAGYCFEKAIRELKGVGAMLPNGITTAQWDIHAPEEGGAE